MYTNSEQIVTFLNKAQSKVAELSTQMVLSKNHDNVELAIEILDFMENLDNEWCPWSEEEISQHIDYYNSKAALNVIPFLQIIGYSVSVSTGTTTESSGISISSVDDIPDYKTKTKGLITSTSHSEFKGLQGGKTGEMYHFTASQHAKLLALIFTQPTVNINLLSTIPSATNGVFEKGTSVTNFRVLGSTVVNDAGKHVSSKYLIGTTVLATYIGDDINNVYEHTSSITANTTIKYQATYTEGSMKETSTQIKFELPYYSALDTTGKSFTALTKTKVLVSKPSQANIAYNIPTGNATSNTPVLPYAFFPASWGNVTSIGANGLFTFDYLGSFTKTTVSVTLADGSSENYNKYEYGVATQGNMTFNFKF
jgi:hypothetical protein